MRKLIVALLFAVACASPGFDARRAPGAERYASDAAKALIHGDYAWALDTAERGLVAHPGDPWLLYDQGAALAGLGRTDESLAALRRAERLFPAANIHGRSVAIYRRAMALEVAGRCEEEADELQRYAQLAKPADPDFVLHALAHVRLCKLANAGIKSF